ncbi:cell division protein FtsL [Candidatus Dependentiae bacterium]|nr:cell division protein FtsL [Candidatus Dependentiae bacterium]
MKKISLITIVALINIVFAFLLIYKQNKIIALLYEIQHLKEEREKLLETKKSLLVDLSKEEKLSTVNNFAQQELAMKPITLKEVKTLTLPRNQDGQQQ